METRERVQTVVYLDRGLYERLRRASFDRREFQYAIVAEGLRRYLDELDAQREGDRRP